MPEPEACAHSACGRSAFTGGLCAQHFVTSGLAATRDPDGRLRYTDLDLSGAVFENATLTRITFEGETHFDRCRFAGEVRFENCAFTGYVSFVGATAGRLAFRECRFTHIVDLAGTEFGDLSIRRSEFESPVELELGPGAVDVHLTTFGGRSRLVGAPASLELVRVGFRSGAQLLLGGTDVSLHDVDFATPSSLGPDHVPGDARSRSTGEYGESLPRLRYVTDTDVSRLSVSYTDLTRCTFARAHNLDGIGIDSLFAFPWAPRGPYTRRRVLWDEARLRVRRRASHQWEKIAGPERPEVRVTPEQIAADYRALRKAREDAKDEPGAADFYYGEMEMRRMVCRDRMYAARSWGQWIGSASESVLLWLYWAVSGYGLRAWRALTALLTVLLGASVIFRYAGFPGDTHTYAASLRFAIQAAMSLVRGTDETLTPTGEWVALALRLLGPLLFGLALLALRGRVRR